MAGIDDLMPNPILRKWLKIALSVNRATFKRKVKKRKRMLNWSESLKHIKREC